MSVPLRNTVVAVLDGHVLAVEESTADNNNQYDNTDHVATEYNAANAKSDKTEE